MNTVTARLGVLFVLLVSVFAFSFANEFPLLAYLPGTSGCEAGQLCVHFLDVGQGDATFIESPNGTQILIDGGPGSGVLRELGDHMEFFDRSLDMVIATHPDQDHIGGLVSVLERYRVATILHTQNQSETPAARTFVTAVADETKNTFHARSGQVFDIGGGASLEILFPDRNAEEFESNASSIVARLVYDETEFLFMGDAPKAIEKYLVAFYKDRLSSDVLKVGHHGSDTSTAETFVSAVDPEYAVISAGRDNRYGHPHEEVLDTLAGHNIQTKNTAEDGSATFISNGETLELK